ncbi:MAG: hypothetical protein K2N81_06600 [Acetatifactor sp.]|nr:hypothetical protein [Acetatifactor sp.]
MEKKSEIIKKKIPKLITMDEKQLYEDVCFILKQAREQAYNKASGIMTYAYWNVGRRIVEQEQYGEKKAQLHESQQIFASKYMTVLPTIEELQRELEKNQLIYSYDK